MSEESFPDEEFKSHCQVRTSCKCKGSTDAWVDSLGIGDNCEEAQENMFEAYTYLCAGAGEGPPVFATSNWRCSCDRE
jgi:hypothetical protein